MKLKSAMDRERMARSDAETHDLKLKYETLVKQIAIMEQRMN